MTRVGEPQSGPSLPAVPGTNSSKLQAVAATGALWTVLEVGFRLGTRIGVLAVLARFLDPADFGLYSAAVIVFELALALSTVGVEQAIVQRPSLSRAELSAAWLVVAASGVAVAVAQVSTATILSRLFLMPDLTRILAVGAPLVLLQSLSQLPTAQLRRDMRFRALAVVNLFAGNVMSSAFSVLFAVLGYGYWALVAGFAAEVFLRFGASIVLAPPRFSFRLHEVLLAVPGLLKYGFGQTLASLLNLVARQGDYVVVGALLGATALGYYTRAYQLMSVVPGVVSELAARVLFPVFARAHTDRGAFFDASSGAVSLASVFALPASGALVVLAPALVHALLGHGWDPVIGPLQVLSLGVFFRVAISTAGAISLASAQVYALAARQGLYSLAVVGGAWYASRYGILGVATSTLLAMGIFLASMIHLVHGASGVPLSRLARDSLHGIYGLVVVLALGIPARIISDRLGLPLVTVAVSGLIVAAGVGAVTMIAPARILGPHLFPWAQRHGLERFRRQCG